MDFDTTWNIEKYYSPTEPKQHWDLKRTFIEENKEKFNEERLVCLAQTLVNIEILGCRYIITFL